MSLRYLVLILILLISGQALALEARVLIDDHRITKKVVGDLRVRCLQDQNQSCTGKIYLLPKGIWRLERYYNQLRVTNLETKAKKFIPGSHFEFTGTFSVEGKSVQRMDLVFVDRDTHWVAHFPIDQYLYGVMNAEVPASWPIEALKAQAVASRTYFLFKKRERQDEHYDVRSDIMDQVFKLKARKHQNILKAVNDTSGEILVSKDSGQVFPAYFHSDCGGHTSPEHRVWRKPSSLNEPVPDKYCQTASKNNWSFGIDKQKLLNHLHQVFYLPKGAELVSILPRIQHEGRAHIVDFLFSNNIIKRIRANDLRQLLGFGRLRSTQFEVQETWDKVVFLGRGFGHGVGMCQWGAQRWARKGSRYGSILKHYYPRARLKKLDARSLHAQMVF